MELKMEEQEESARVGIVKVSLEKGFSRYVLVPYGQAFGALTTGVLAFSMKAAAGNLLPSITFLLAILCRMEKLDISQRGAQAKIVGTVVAFAGATLMTLYKGIVVVSVLHTQHSHQTFTSKASLDKNWLKGSFMLVISILSYSAFYILQ
ncbi:wat1-related protein, partial [Quercus suber]